MTTYSGAADDGSTVTYRDPKRIAWLVGGLWTFFLPLVVIGLYQLTGAQDWVLLVLPLYVFLLMPLIDYWVGEDRSNPPEAVMPALIADSYFLAVAKVLVAAGYVGMIAGLAFLAKSEAALWAKIAFLIGFGIVNGTMITLAHELGHKTDAGNRLFAKLSLGAIGYGHFCAEHNLGHHKNVATPADCASARMGETVYGFALREIPGAIRGAFAIERQRLGKRGLGFWSVHNDILQSYAITLIVAAALVVWLGWGALPYIIAHHALAWFALTMVNYIEHYGLLRATLPNGRYEPCQPHHSWNTNHIVSNVMQIHLQRHSDHHTHPMRPYQALRNFDDLPSLPSGYPGCLTLAALPPLWFRIMDPKVVAWARGDISKVHLHEPARRRLEARWAAQ